MDVRSLLREPERTWYAQPGASETDLNRLAAASPVPLPPLLFDFLRFSNGGEGPLALPPLLFVLDGVDYIITNLQARSIRDLYPGLLFFGSNGGLERIGF